MRGGVVRIATRESRLALWQAEHVADRLRSLDGDIEVSLVPMTTKGDRHLETSLAKIGGKGLFIKELELAIQRGDADIAVHSMKDVPVELPAGLGIAAVLERADPRDALVSRQFESLETLPDGARVGTSSLRRQCQLRARHPNLDVIPLRGNVDTRLRRLDEGRFEAIILAAAGLDRLGLGERIRERLNPEISLPAVGQGIIGIECRRDDDGTLALLERLEHAPTRHCLAAERACAARLGVDCHAPMAGFAEVVDERLRLRGLIGLPDGNRIVQAELHGLPAAADELGQELARELLSQGAADILRELQAAQ